LALIRSAFPFVGAVFVGVVIEKFCRRKEGQVPETNIQFPAGSSPRDRVVIAAKYLFGALGYENTTIEAICLEAGVSEPQLIKHFGSKESLLEAIFEEGWARLRLQMPVLQNVQSPKKKLKMLLHLLMKLFTEDRQLRDLMLLEGRRLRRENKMVMLTASYKDIVALLDSLIQAEYQGKAAKAQVQLVRSSLIGMFEGLLRDRVLHERFGFPAEFSAEDVERYVSELVDRLIGP
jgi:AcrR family transcriptional regulator